MVHRRNAVANDCLSVVLKPDDRLFQILARVLFRHDAVECAQKRREFEQRRRKNLSTPLLGRSSSFLADFCGIFASIEIDGRIVQSSKFLVLFCLSILASMLRCVDVSSYRKFEKADFFFGFLTFFSRRRRRYLRGRYFISTEIEFPY